MLSGDYCKIRRDAEVHDVEFYKVFEETVEEVERKMVSMLKNREAKKLISEQIGEGPAVIEKEDVDSPIKFVTIKQGKARFFSRYNESPNGVYMVAFADGHLERIENQEKWVDGQVCLVKDLKTVLWSNRLGRPNDGTVSNNGQVAINDWLKLKQTLGGKFYVFDQSGKLLVEREFDSNLAACAISQDGNYAAASTAFPDNSIYLFDVKSGTLKWRFENLARKVALGLSFSKNNDVFVYTGKTVASQKYDYSLTLNGQLSEDSTREFEKLKQIREGMVEESLEPLIAFLSSSDSSKILKGLDAAQSLVYKKDRKFNYREIVPYLLQHVEGSDLEVSKLSIKLMLQIGKISPEWIESILPRVIEKCKKLLNTRFEGEYAIMTLGELGTLNANCAKEVMPLIIDRLEKSSVWNERRFAAFAVGQIGKLNPDLVRNAIPILARYLGKSDWWLPQVREAERETVDVGGIKISISIGGGPNPEVWVRDAALGALGDIGENNPEAVKDTIPMIVSCLQRPEPYTRKKAIVALSQIAKKGRIYVESVFPTLEEIAQKDSDQKVRLEAQRVLESISPRAAELSVSNIPNLIASLSSEDKLARYRSLRELERMFYARPSLPEKYHHEALQIMNRSSSDLMRCIEKIEEELRVSQDEITRSLLLESLLMAKRTFLEFIVGEYVGNDSFKCRFCGKVYKASGIRNHLSKAHPEKWKLVRPYSDDILKHLEVKNLSGLSSEEWERQLLEKYEKISRKHN